MLAKIWYTRIIAGTKSFVECPDRYKEDVIQFLKDAVKFNLDGVSELRFKEITGMEYKED